MQCSGSDRVEIMVITKESGEVVICSKKDASPIMDCINSSNNIEIDTSKNLIVGARYVDTLSFKQPFETKSILNNFGVRI